MSKIVAVAGPTAVGKTKFAMDIALHFDGEIVSCDSMQLYQFMDIGSAKPTEEERMQVPHHLVDVIDPRCDFSAAQYQSLAKEAIRDILSRNKLPVVAGGTGLYLNSLLYDMDFSGMPQNAKYRAELEAIARKEGSGKLHDMLSKRDAQAAASIHPHNAKKLIRALERLHEGEGSVKPFSEARRETNDYEAILIGLTRDRAELYERINRRVDILIERGLIEEVEDLMALGLAENHISMKAIGYKEIMEYLRGNVSLEEAIEKVKKNTRNYAKKQLTWFRRYDKMKWYNISEYRYEEEAVEDIVRWLRIRL